MIGKIFKLFGDSNEKQLKHYQWVVAKVAEQENWFREQPGEQFPDFTKALGLRFHSGEKLEDLMVEAFALTREAARRVIGQRHFDEQLIGGAVLHGGNVAEMKTGEGKTLAAALPTYLNALGGRGSHVVTVNDYLARRDAAWMGAVYHALGLSVACLQHEAAYLFEPGRAAEGACPTSLTVRITSSDSITSVTIWRWTAGKRCSAR